MNIGLLISSGLIPELCATFRRKNPGCRLTDEQLAFVVNCSLNPEFARTSHTVTLPDGKGGVAHRVKEKHTSHPELFADAFHADPEHFVKILKTMPANAQLKRGSGRIRAARAATVLAVKYLNGDCCFPSADEIRFQAGKPLITPKQAEAARTEIARRYRSASDPKTSTPPI